MTGRGGAIRAAALLSVLFALIATAVLLGWARGIDHGLMLAAGSVPEGFWSGVTRLGDTVSRFSIAGVVALILFLLRDRAGALFLVGAVVGGAGLNTLLKGVFARPRPDLLPHLDLVTSSSFPSGHSAGALVLGFALALVAVRHGASRRIAYALAGVFALSVGVSRVALAVHWPSDVLAGWSAGGVWLIACAAIVARATGTSVDSPPRRG